MKKNKFTVAANWKMNPTSALEAKKLFAHYKRLAKKYPKYNFICAVPAVYISELARNARPANLYISAQNIYFKDSGSYTGSVSIPMVRDAGADAVMVGHSERRNIFGVSDEVITQKITQALEHNIPVIVCFGEKKRDTKGRYIEELERQITAIVEPFVGTNKIKLLSLAYEPVWAIGAGAKRAVTEDELFSTLILIRNILGKKLNKSLGAKPVDAIPLWYGGSVNPDNAGSLVSVPHVNGFLIGRAGLDSVKISAISQSI